VVPLAVVAEDGMAVDSLAARKMIAQERSVLVETAQTEFHMSQDSRKVRFLFLVLAISLAACHQSEHAGPKAFATPGDAGNALVAAVKSGNEAELMTIFGPNSKELISSGDPVQDKNAGNAFVKGYDEMHRWRMLDDRAQILLVGADNFPFAIPLKENANGKWFFDTAAGRDEVLNRRIGRNELTIIDVCQSAADAEAQYFSQLHDGATTQQYAQKFLSDPGKQNGLYWASSEGQPQSPLGPLVAFATSEGYNAKPDAHTPFHGYYFRMLKTQGSNAPGGAKDYLVDGKMVRGFAFVAYPAQYGNSGVMTFMINQDGVLLQKDLGTTTMQTATAMPSFDPDASWRPVEE
jgi:hypothetical protein